MPQWDAEKELEAVEADWAERRIKLKEPVSSNDGYALWQWARISSWFAIIGVPILLVLADPYYAGGFSIMFGLILLGCLSAIKPDRCQACKEYEAKIALF